MSYAFINQAPCCLLYQIASIRARLYHRAKDSSSECISVYLEENLRLSQEDVYFGQGLQFELLSLKLLFSLEFQRRKDKVFIGVLDTFESIFCPEKHVRYLSTL